MASIFPILTPPQTRGEGGVQTEQTRYYQPIDDLNTRYPAQLGTPPFEKWMLFEVRSGRHVARDGFAAEDATNVDRTLASVALYLPMDAMKSTTTVEWSTSENYGAAAGAAIEAAFQKGSSPNVTTMSGAGKALGNVLANAPAVVKSAAGAMATQATAKGINAFNEAVGSEGSAEAIMSGALGKTVNPRTDVLFKNVDYRTHTFSFKLIPRSYDEAIAIDTLLNIFQYFSLPDYGQGSLNFFIGYPYEFMITLFTQQNGSTHHLNTINRSVLTSMAVDHAGGGRVAFVDGYGGQQFFPAATSLELEFKETRLLGRDDDSAVWRATNNKVPSALRANDPRLGQPEPTS
jgi:hypothetical protein